VTCVLGGATGVVRIGSQGAIHPAPHGVFESRRGIHTTAVAPTALAADTQLELSTGSQLDAPSTPPHQEVISKAAAVHDPFRPLRSSVDPIVINILVKAYSSKDDVERVCRKALRRRAKSPDLVSNFDGANMIYHPLLLLPPPLPSSSSAAAATMIVVVGRLVHLSKDYERNN